jgi:hypothetical protein
MRRSVQNKANYRESKGKSRDTARLALGGPGECPSFPSRRHSHCRRRSPFPRRSRVSGSSMEGTYGADELPWKEGGGWEGNREKFLRKGRGRGGLTRAATTGWFQVADAAPSSRPICFLSCSKRYEEPFPSLSERGTSETFEWGRTQERPALELCPVSTPKFHRHPNTGIHSTKFQIYDSKPSFLHPNRALVNLG